MSSPQSNGIALGDPGAMLVGRLLPLPGVALRPQPDPRRLCQFLHELQLPLAAQHTMLELAASHDLPEAVQLALTAASSHTEHLQQLVADYATYGRLEQNLVEPKPAASVLLDWLRDCHAQQRWLAESCGIALELDFRSLLPSVVMFDASLATRALGAVLRVAMQRALPGRLDLRIAYDEPRRVGGVGKLLFDFETRGGGFREIEHGYLFAPFVVRDGASRASLGLSIGQRLCELLGGELRVESPGTSVCHYRIVLAADAADHAVWLDPIGRRGHLGPVRPGRLLFVGGCAAVLARSRGRLTRAGYEVEHVEQAEQAFQRLGTGTTRWSAVVVDAACDAMMLAGFVAALRARGLTVPILAAGQQEADESLAIEGLDEVLTAPDGSMLLAALRDGLWRQTGAMARMQGPSPLPPPTASPDH